MGRMGGGGRGCEARAAADAGELGQLARGAAGVAEACAACRRRARHLATSPYCAACPPVCLPAAKNVILAGVKSITLHDRAEVRGRGAGARCVPRLWLHPGGALARPLHSSPPIARRRRPPGCAARRWPCATWAPSSTWRRATWGATAPRPAATQCRSSTPACRWRPAPPTSPTTSWRSSRCVGVGAGVAWWGWGRGRRVDAGPLPAAYACSVCVCASAACGAAGSGAGLPAPAAPLPTPAPPCPALLCPALHPRPRPAQVVVATETSLAESIRVDDFCHAQGIAFIKASACREGGGAWGACLLERTHTGQCPNSHRHCRKGGAHGVLPARRAAARPRPRPRPRTRHCPTHPRSSSLFSPGRHPRRVCPGLLRLWAGI